ncbi:MAG: hypothetical protein GWP61_10105 [Chloroflexi bacterium]|nr:hypothetical protein [Chloroflexota bacterium]
MAWTYNGLGRRKGLLQFYEEALPIRCEVGDRSGEATTLWNVAMLLQHWSGLQRLLSE